MKVIVSLKGISLAIICVLALAAGVSAQAPRSKDARPASTEAKAVRSVPLPAPDLTSSEGDKTSDDELARPDEADEILPYYTNYLKEYRLGPSDMISIEVFGQCPDYCKTGITIPPNARISYPLIREGVMVAGRTVEQVASDITKKLDEFIIDPKVTVTLDRAMSTRYSVMGNVVTPGVRVMDRKVSVYEAIIESGGVTKNGDRNKISIISYGKDGRLNSRRVSLSMMESGKAEMVYLNPGDQVFVAGKGFSIEKVFDILGKASAARLLFGSPF